MSSLFSSRIVAAIACGVPARLGCPCADGCTRGFENRHRRVRARQYDRAGSGSCNGIKTENKVQLGNTKIMRGAITAGEIDIYPEYTGNGAFFFSAETDLEWKNAKAGYEKVKALDFAKNRIVWLEPAPANNTWAIAVRKDVATTHGLKSLADLGKWVAGGGRFKLAASAEFVERPDALPAFQAAYGFKLKQDQLLTLAGGDTAVTIVPQPNERRVSMVRWRTAPMERWPPSGS